VVFGRLDGEECVGHSSIYIGGESV
jgi:hypothetical protein